MQQTKCKRILPFSGNGAVGCSFPFDIGNAISTFDAVANENAGAFGGCVIAAIAVAVTLP